MKAYHRFEWDCMDIDFMTFTDIQYYDAEGNYSIDFEVKTQGEYPFMVRLHAPFNVKNFPVVYNYLTSLPIDYNDKIAYIQWIIEEFGNLIIHISKVMLESLAEEYYKDKNIEGYQ